jgi:putative DNA primase/helicase
MDIFNELNAKLLASAHTILFDLVPGGKLNGNEYEASSILGGSGDSFKFNIQKGSWAEFNNGPKGNGIIALYAAIHNVKPYEALKNLSEKYGFTLVKPIQKNGFINSKFGKPEAIYDYRDRSGNVYAHAVRYLTGETVLVDGKPKPDKTFRQCHYDGNGKLVWKKPSNPQLYKVDQILANPDKKIMVCEGEKAADAAQKLFSSYVTTTAIGGSSAYSKTNWNELANRDVIIWPDNDETGLDYADNVAAILIKICKSVSVIQVNLDKNLSSKFDAADAIQDGWDNKRTANWARPLLKSFNIYKKAELVETQPDKSNPSSQEVEAGSVSKFKKTELQNMWVNELTLQMNQKNTEPVANMLNVYTILTQHDFYKNAFKYDSFSMTRFYREKLYTEEVDLQILKEIQGSFSIKNCYKSHVTDAINLVYSENTFNSAQEWIKSLEWDQKPRIDSFFKTYYGADPNNESNDYVSDVSKNFWISMVNRIFSPGCKVDNLVILEGEQGIMKTTSLQAIAGPFFGRAMISPGDKDNTMKFRGKFLIELAELRSSKYATEDEIKAFFDEREDEMRDPYGRMIKKNLRTFVFVGTTNDDNYLKDPTGARRYWPIRAHKIDLDGITKDRSQLFAEAYSRINEPYWYINGEQAKVIRDERQYYLDDPWTDLISNWVKYEQSFHTNWLMEDCLKFSNSNMKSMDSMRANKILRSLGWINKPIRHDGKVSKMWIKSGHIAVTKPVVAVTNEWPPWPNSKD